jgi:unsaturated pyranuronate lyase
VIKSRNADVEAVAVSAVEGKPMYGGDMLVKPLIKGDEMTFLEIHYAAGVGAPLHTHTHESIAYVVKGKVKSTVGRQPNSVEIDPTATCSERQGSYSSPPIC